MLPTRWLVPLATSAVLHATVVIAGLAVVMSREEPVLFVDLTRAGEPGESATTEGGSERAGPAAGSRANQSGVHGDGEGTDSGRPPRGPAMRSRGPRASDARVPGAGASAGPPGVAPRETSPNRATPEASTPAATAPAHALEGASSGRPEGVPSEVARSQGAQSRSGAHGVEGDRQPAAATEPDRSRDLDPAVSSQVTAPTNAVASEAPASAPLPAGDHRDRDVRMSSPASDGRGAGADRRAETAVAGSVSTEHGGNNGQSSGTDGGRGTGGGSGRGATGDRGDGGTRGSGAGSRTGGGGGSGGGSGGGAGGSAGGGADRQALVFGSSDGEQEYAAYWALLRQRVQESLRYPDSAYRRDVTGVVHVEVRIEPSGRIAGATVVRSSSHRALDDAAIESVKSIGRVPFPAGLRPRAIRVVLPVVFEIHHAEGATH
jgi:TonB family protein